MKTREQEYAADVFTRVRKFKEGEKDQIKKYGAMAHQLPILIRTSGLVQALTFVQSSAEPSHHRLLEDLAQTVKEGNKDQPEDLTQTVKERDKDQLLASCRDGSLADYMRLTQKTMAALLWYKRFAQSVLEVKQGEESK